jgi:hypothetical protein
MKSFDRVRLLIALAAAPVLGWWALNWRFVAEWSPAMGRRSVLKLFMYSCEHVSTPEIVKLVAVGLVLGVVAVGTNLRRGSVFMSAPALIGLAAASTFPLLMLVDVVTVASGKVHQMIPAEIILHGCYAAIVAVAAAVPHVLVKVLGRQGSGIAR